MLGPKSAEPTKVKSTNAGDARRILGEGTEASTSSRSKGRRVRTARIRREGSAFYDDWNTAGPVRSWGRRKNQGRNYRLRWLRPIKLKPQNFSASWFRLAAATAVKPLRPLNRAVKFQASRFNLARKIVDVDLRVNRNRLKSLCIFVDGCGKKASWDDRKKAAKNQGRNYRLRWLRPL